MKVLQIIAHPSPKSFTGDLAQAFRAGAEQAGHSVQTFNIFKEFETQFASEAILEADHICFAWPCWFEMPPAKLVDFFQTVFVHGFAFELQGDRMVPKLNIPVTCMISMGQFKSHNTDGLLEAMTYCGLHPKFAIFQNIGPRLTPGQAGLYLAIAEREGFNLKGK